MTANFCERKNLKSEIIKVYNHVPHDMEMCIRFQGFAEIQNGHHGLTS